MKLMCLLSLLCAVPATAGEFYASVGKTTPAQGGDPVGAASLGWRGERYGVEATWIAEAEIYDGTVVVPAFGMVTGYRYWQTERTFLGARLNGLVGLSLKDSDRCARNHELNCNRRLPLPFAFHFGIEAEWRDWIIGAYHDSNDAMDYGPENKNLGVNWLAIKLKFN